MIHQITKALVNSIKNSVIEEIKAESFKKFIATNTSTKDVATWKSADNFMSYLKSKNYDIEIFPDFIYAKFNQKYYGFYDKYAGDGILLNKKHSGFETREKLLEALVDD